MRTLRQPLLALLLALATLLTFLPALDNGFVNYDDTLYVTANPQVQQGLTPSGVRWAFASFYASNWHPLTLLSHMLDVELFGLKPRGHHLTSVLLHAANAALLFAVLATMTGAPGPSLLAAALFALHPLRVESVAWIAERKDVLSAFFWLLTLGAYHRYARERGREARPYQRGNARLISIGSYLLVVALFALGLMTKAMVVTLPCVLLLLDLWPLGRLGWEGSPTATARRLAVLGVEKLPLFALAAVTGWLTVLAQGEVIARSAPASLGLRLANAMVAYADYLAKTVWPSGLAVFYPYPQHIAFAEVLAAAVLLVALSALALVGLRRGAPYLAVGWLWFLGTLVPVIGLLQVGEQAMADRYTYIPAMGLVIVVAWGLTALARTPRRRGVLMAGAGTVLLLLAIGCRRQIAHWHDGASLFRHALAVTERNDLAHLNLAEALRHRGAVEEARQHYEAALALRPDQPDLQGALGSALRAWGEPAAAVPHLRTAIALAPQDPRYPFTLAMALRDLGENAAAITALRTVLALEPGFARAHYGLGTLLDATGEETEALEHYRQALRLDPGLEALYTLVGTRLAARGELDAAAALLAEAVRRQPAAASNHFNLAIVREQQGRLDEARRHLERARTLAPADPQVAAAYARLNATP